MDAPQPPKTPPTRPTLLTTGWREWVYLPDLDIGPIKAKIDTGAKTSALHAYDLVVDRDAGIVRFKVHTIQRRTDFFVEVQAPLVDERVVRDSGANATLRPVIATNLTLLGRSMPIEVTLTDRIEMGFRMLIGREALSGRYIVDPAASCLGGVPELVRNWRPESPEATS